MFQSNGSEARNFDFLDIITILSLILQVQSLEELHNQASTDDIYTELQKQDRRYLDRIIAKLDLILDNQSDIKNQQEVICSKLSALTDDLFPCKG